MNEIITVLRRVIMTLGRVEVRGADNLDMLLGCIRALEKAADKLGAEKEE